jgi:hypothetical protein
MREDHFEQNSLPYRKNMNKSFFLPLEVLEEKDQHRGFSGPNQHKRLG